SPSTSEFGFNDSKSGCDGLVWLHARRYHSRAADKDNSSGSPSGVDGHCGRRRTGRGRSGTGGTFLSCGDEYRTVATFEFPGAKVRISDSPGRKCLVVKSSPGKTGIA